MALTMKPAAMRLAPAGNTTLGPRRSSIRPHTGADRVHATEPRVSAPAAKPRLQWNSSMTATKNSANAPRHPKAAATVVNEMPSTAHG